MKKLPLSKADNKRSHRVAIFGAVLAVGISAAIIFLGFYESTVPFGWGMVLVYCPSAGLATWLSIRYCWKHLMRDGETRKRGAFYGGMSVFLSLFLMSFFVVIGGGIYELVLDGTTSQILQVETLFMVPVLTFVLAFWAFIFGGFLAIPVGAFAGYMLTKNPKINANASSPHKSKVIT